MFGAAVRATLPDPPVKPLTKEAYDEYVNEDWARWSQYCEGMGLSSYPWEPSETFEEWKLVQQASGNHKWSWD